VALMAFLSKEDDEIGVMIGVSLGQTTIIDESQLTNLSSRYLGPHRTLPLLH
jgi:hypothetical protein